MNYRELLYDAEIEYLQGDGYAYLSLMPIKELSPDVANWSIDWMKRVSGIHVFGGMNTDSMQLVSNYNTFRFDWCKSNSSESVSINVNTRYSLVQEDGYLKINNVSKECTKNITQTTKFFLFTKNPRESNTQFKGNIYGMKVWSRSTGHILYDFIPVRKGNVGYLFDKVSLKLYGNVGSGAFILGSDVAPAAYVNEVAFLESWGNQYIDTGIKPSTDTKIELKCLYCKSGAGLTNYGALIGADDRDNAYILNHSAVANFTYGLEFSNNFANSQTRLLTFDSTASPQNMRVYDEEGSLVTTLTCIRGVFEVNQNLYLFALNRSGTPVYGSNRILYCKIYNGDTLVRDYVPVEYNGIGYMYDKVSGLFFDNKGTGKFLFGSIAKACARSYTRRQLMADTVLPKPYISDGLVMHFDGADFDGTTTWNSRVGGFVATKAGSGSIVKTSDGGVEFIGGASTNNPRCFTINKVVNVANTVGTIEVCAYRKAKNTSNMETILDWGTINIISYKINSARTAAMIANYTSNSPSAPITYGVGKFTHSINNDRQVWNGQSKALGANGNASRGGNTIGGRKGGGNWNFIGVIYQIRIYNRKLSEAEMKWNQDQDRKKYGIQF